MRSDRRQQHCNAYLVLDLECDVIVEVGKSLREVMKLLHLQLELLRHRAAVEELLVQQLLLVQPTTPCAPLAAVQTHDGK